MNYIDWCKEFYAEHPAMSIGLLGGVACGLSIAVFGLCDTLVVAACVAVGVFIGWRMDSGDDVGAWPDKVKSRWHEWRGGKSGK